MTIKSSLNTRLSGLLLDLKLDVEAVDKLVQYIDLLLKVNKRVSLTSVKSFDEWFVSHIEDSLRAYLLFKDLEADYYIDSGSGNGLPGVIFAILSKLPFTLCDIDTRKAEFLKTVCHRLKLEGDVYCGPIEDLAAKSKYKRNFYVYRGLGPDKFLTNQFELDSAAGHFRFVSEEQNLLFPDSNKVFYELSDKSRRFLEISPVK